MYGLVFGVGSVGGIEIAEMSHHGVAHFVGPLAGVYHVYFWVGFGGKFFGVEKFGEYGFGGFFGYGIDIGTVEWIDVLDFFYAEF